MNERRPDSTLIPGDSPLSHCMQIIWHFGVLFNIDWGPMQKNKDILLKLILYVRYDNYGVGIWQSCLPTPTVDYKRG